MQSTRLSPEAREHLLAPRSAEIDLHEEAKRLRLEAQYMEHGHGATTLIRYPDLRVVQMALKGGTLIREHQTEGRVLVQCISGRLRLDMPEGRAELAAGQVLALERCVPHDLEAMEDSDVLITIAWQGHERDTAR
jgi:quercetin dioxygenase-like cupin family protein